MSRAITSYTPSVLKDLWLFDVLIILVVTSLVLFARHRANRLRTRPRPGPPGLPVVGNLFDFPTTDPCLAAAKWKEQYGDITFLNILGTTMVYLHSVEAVKDLLVKRGAIYSDRPPLIMVTELCAFQPAVLGSYDDKLRRQRALMDRVLGAATVPTYHPLLELETCGLLQRLIDSTEDYGVSITRYASTLSLLVVYGHRVTSNDDEMLVTAKEITDLLSNEILAAPPKGIWAVDVFPLLKYIPSWFPFASFKRKAEVWREQIVPFIERPLQEVKKKVAEGTAIHSFCSLILQEEQESMTAEKDYDVKWAANTIVTGSIDTISTVVQHTLLLMLLHPEKFSRAREEIDNIVKGRLPTFADRASLPFTECVLSEVIRLAAPIPLGLPHRLRQDDFYDGYLIPKDSVVIANIVGMLRDEKLYSDPEAFIPERFESTIVDEATRKARDPRQWAFGFGRRRCPGVHLADSSTWLALVSIVATLDVTKVIDMHGNTIEPEVKFDNFIFRLPNKFACRIEPRSKYHEAIIANAGLSATIQ
ncbi:hypothetical protein CERSUDRAFT_161182 [Gelatoporia subvermispora B]|uniref:Cytochrome P450 n=1 Tax=Ceriporiopsis subvermispora (strain B) TaxID=914234 RepID=M2QKN5_CERS8|nr:hypothetical protein CERSUDRAFT_161182 [Gelatoporia subvermispora B]